MKDGCKLMQAVVQLGTVRGRLQHSGNWPNTEKLLSEAIDTLLKLQCEKCSKSKT